MISYKGNRLSWKEVTKELKRKYPDLDLVPSLEQGKIKYFKNKITIYLNQKSSKEIKDNHWESLEEIFFSFLKKKYPIEIKSSGIEYEFIEKHISFLKKRNHNNFYICNQNLSASKNLKSFIEDQNLKNNICYLWGKSKIGKTHILGAVLSLYEKELDFLYIDTSDFIDKYYEYQKTNKSLKCLYEWLTTYELLVFDSFHLLGNKKSINEEFVYLSKNLKKAIFISSYNKYIFEGLSEKLSHSFSFIIKVNSPDREDLKTIIIKFLNDHNKNIKFSEEAINFLINNSKTSIPWITNQLVNILVLIGNPSFLTIVDIKELKRFLKKTDFFKFIQQSPSSQGIKQVKSICRKLDFDLKEVVNDTRKKEIVLKRNIVIYLLKVKYNLTHENIGRILNKNHSTISYSLKKIEEKLKDKHFKKYLDNFF